MQASQYVGLMAVIGAALLSGCATRGQQKDGDEGIKSATRAELDCATRVLPLLDDLKSDAMTIALSVALQCNSEYQATTEAVAATLDNDAQRRMLTRQRNTQEQKIQAYLPWVLQYRRLTRTPG